MKLKYILASFIAAAAVLTGCVKEEPVSVLEGLTVSNDYVTLASDAGSSVSITVNGVDSWTATVGTTKSEWLSLGNASGSAGQDVSLTLTAVSASSAARAAEVHIAMGGKTKIIVVMQAAPKGVEVPPSTVKEILEGPDKTYKVTGTVTKITNTHYGNWYINDGTVEGDGLYIYGTLDKKGADNSSANKWDNLNDPSYANSWTLAVGDKVTIEGPRSVYNGTVELVNVTIVKIEPSLIDVAAFDFEKLPAIDTTFNMMVTAKESPLLLTSDADWLQIVSVNPDGSYKLHANENLKTAERTANISITGPTSMKSVAITQKGVPASGASISEILTMEKGSAVQTLPTTVVTALTTKGAVLSDGTKAIYAYGAEAAALKIGNGVKMSASKTVYNGVHELEKISDVFVDNEKVSFSYPVAKDITANAGAYTNTEAEFIKLTGTLAVDGTYYNLVLDNVDGLQGSINYPIDALNMKSFDGKKITVTGYYNGSNTNKNTGMKYINIIAVKVEEFVENPKGTVTNPFTVADAINAVKDLTWTSNSEYDKVGPYYVKGIISKIGNKGTFTEGGTYGNATFFISDDGTENNELQCFRILYLDNQKFVEGQTDIKVGDKVVICGELMNYKGNTPETVSGKAYLYSLNAAEAGDGSLANPFTVADAINAVKDLTWTSNSEYDKVGPYYVKGKISKIGSKGTFTEGGSYGNATFFISDDGTENNEFQCFRVLYLGNQKFTEGKTDIKVGDDVVICGELMNYKGNTPETVSGKAYVYSLNGKTE